MNIKEKCKAIISKSIELTKKINTRHMIIAGSVLLICAAVGLNFVLYSEDDIGYGQNNMSDNINASAQGNNETDYFASTQLSRQKARDEALEVLQSVVDNVEAVEATKDQALNEISKIASDIQLEANIETLITSKGFSQCVAVINGDSVNIIVKTEGLLANEVAHINEIVYEQTGTDPANIKIIEKKA
ncbi:MAG: SpoIIIAH-like family protein [Clostridia bacterium]|nr:SpoIIIAH-like family protein [Clostridia bacterium]